jgi:hypothetical protein
VQKLTGFRYLTCIHQYLPFLTSNKAKLQVELALYPQQLRDSFVEALYASVTSFSSMEKVGDARIAQSMLLEWDEGTKSDQSPATRLLYLQTLLLLIVEADNRALSHPSSHKRILLGMAIAEAYEMKLYLSKNEVNLDGEVDLDSVEQLRLRAWWSLVMLDRWNAIGNGTAPIINNEAAVAPNYLRSALGETSYLLLRRFSNTLIYRREQPAN